MLPVIENMTRPVMNEISDVTSVSESVEHRSLEVSQVTKIWRCSYCNHVSWRKGDLQRHIFRHTGERPFPCWLCSNAFTRKIHLKTHLKKVHDQGLPGS